jgi:hypothetical protein
MKTLRRLTSVLDSLDRRHFLRVSGVGAAGLVLASRSPSRAQDEEMLTLHCQSGTGIYEGAPFEVTAGAGIVGTSSDIAPLALLAAGVDLETGRLVVADELVSTVDLIVRPPAEILQRLTGRETIIKLPFPTTDERYPFASALIAGRSLGAVLWTEDDIPRLFEDPLPPDLQLPQPDDEQVAVDFSQTFSWDTADKIYYFSLMLNGVYMGNKTSPEVEFIKAARALITGVPCPDTPAIKVDIRVKARLYCVNAAPQPDGRRLGWDANLDFMLWATTKLAQRFCDLVNAALGR